MAYELDLRVQAQTGDAINNLERVQDAVRGVESQTTSAGNTMTQSLNSATTATNDLGKAMKDLGKIADSQTLNGVAQGINGINSALKNGDVASGIQGVATAIGNMYMPGLGTLIGAGIGIISTGIEHLSSVLDTASTSITNEQVTEYLKTLNEKVYAFGETAYNIQKQGAVKDLNTSLPTLLTQLEGITKVSADQVIADMGTLKDGATAYWMALNGKKTDGTLLSSMTTDEYNTYMEPIEKFKTALDGLGIQLFKYNPETQQYDYATEIAGVEETLTEKFTLWTEMARIPLRIGVGEDGKYTYTGDYAVLEAFLNQHASEIQPVLEQYGIEIFEKDPTTGQLRVIQDESTVLRSLQQFSKDSNVPISQLKNIATALGLDADSYADLAERLADINEYLAEISEKSGVEITIKSITLSDEDAKISAKIYLSGEVVNLTADTLETLKGLVQGAVTQAQNEGLTGMDQALIDFYHTGDYNALVTAYTTFYTQKAKAEATGQHIAERQLNREQFLVNANENGSAQYVTGSAGYAPEVDEDYMTWRAKHGFTATKSGRTDEQKAWDEYMINFYNEYGKDHGLSPTDVVLLAKQGYFSESGWKENVAYDEIERQAYYDTYGYYPEEYNQHEHYDETTVTEGENPDVTATPKPAESTSSTTPTPPTPGETENENTVDPAVEETKPVNATLSAPTTTTVLTPAGLETLTPLESTGVTLTPLSMDAMTYSQVMTELVESGAVEFTYTDEPFTVPPASLVTPEMTAEELNLLESNSIQFPFTGPQLAGLKAGIDIVRVATGGGILNNTADASTFSGHIAEMWPDATSYMAEYLAQYPGELTLADGTPVGTDIVSTLIEDLVKNAFSEENFADGFSIDEMWELLDEQITAIIDSGTLPYKVLESYTDESGALQVVLTYDESDPADFGNPADTWMNPTEWRKAMYGDDGTGGVFGAQYYNGNVDQSTNNGTVYNVAGDYVTNNYEPAYDTGEN